MRDLLSLVKPRIAALLCLTGVSGALAAGGLPAIELAAFVVAGVGMAGGAAALNCYYDRDIDPEMERTTDRPLADGRLSPRVALAFGLVLLAIATAVGLAALPAVSVGYMWLGVAAYVGLYTVLLKRRHWLGVVLGGSAGSFPVLAGWTAVNPALLPALPALLMAALVFVWTPAHAWALAVVYRDDFAAVDIPTLPVVTSFERTRRAIWLSALATVATAATLLPFAGPAYLGAFAVGTPLFLLAYRQYASAGSDPAAVRAFFTSNAVLGLLFLAWGLDGIVSTGRAGTAVVALATFLAIDRLWTRRPALRGVAAAPGVDWQAALRRLYDRIRHPVTGPEVELDAEG